MVHPMYGPNRFKLGIFSANADGGLTLTRVPERWPAHWDEVVEVAQMADRAGIEFFLPIARWKGFGGEVNSREWSFETLTYAAALAGVTRNIALFSTVHVPMVHPVFAAKALATVDHASGGRAGLNIVCGWSPQEFELFGLTMIEDRYAQGLEWAEIMERIFAGGAPFDYEGRFYQFKNVSGRPVPLQRPRPVTLNAAFSPVGPGVRGEDGGFSVHHVRRYRGRPSAYRRHGGTRAGGRARGRASTPRATWSAGRRRPRPRTTTSTTRCAWRIPRAWISTWAPRRNSPRRMIRRRIACIASVSSVAPAPIR